MDFDLELRRPKFDQVHATGRPHVPSRAQFVRVRSLGWIGQALDHRISPLYCWLSAALRFLVGSHSSAVSGKGERLAPYLLETERFRIRASAGWPDGSRR